MNTEEFISEYKSTYRIFHSSEDKDIGRQLEDSFNGIKYLIGNFNPSEFSIGKELVFERTRFVRNEGLEYFYDNFQTVILDASNELLGEKENDD